MSSSSNSTGNPILDNPGVTATLFAILTVIVFVGMLYNSATSHHGDSDHGKSGHGNSGEHKAAPAAH
jgi:hypothetical protein